MPAVRLGASMNGRREVGNFLLHLQWSHFGPHHYPAQGDRLPRLRPHPSHPKETQFSSSCRSTSYQSPVSTSHTRAPPPPPESSPYLPVSHSQDRRRDSDVTKYSRGPGGTALQSICKETWGAATSIALPASNPIAVRLQPIPECRDMVTSVSASGMHTRGSAPRRAMYLVLRHLER